MAEHSAYDETYVAHLLDDLASVVNVGKKKRSSPPACQTGTAAAVPSLVENFRIDFRHRPSRRNDGDRRGQAEATGLGHPFSWQGRPDGPLRWSGIGTPKFLTFKSVEESIRMWCKINQCPDTPTIADLPNKADDGTTVRRKTYGPGRMVPRSY